MVALLVWVYYFRPSVDVVPIPMPAGDFNIAVANFGVQATGQTNQALLRDLQRDGQSFAQEIADLLISNKSSL